MANRQSRPVGLDTTRYDPRPADAGRIPEAPSGGGGQAAEATSRVALALSQEVGRWADDMAKAEGERSGQADGAEPDFRPSGLPTIRGRAHDQAGVAVYLQKLDADYQRDALDLFDRHRADPAGLDRALGELTEGYRGRLFPEVAEHFDKLAAATSLHWRKAALNAFDSDRREQGRASMIAGMQSRQDSLSRALAADPSSPEAEALAARNEAADIAAIRAQVDSGALAADRAETMIGERRTRTQAEIVEARARTLRTPEEVDAYRARLRADYVAGKRPGLPFEAADAMLDRIARAKRTEATKATKELDSALDDFLDRQSKGLPPPPAEWLALEKRAGDLGPAGLARLDSARARLRLRAQIEALPVAEGEKTLRRIEEQMRAASAGSAREQAAVSFFMGRGWSRAQAAGIVGNLAQESSLRPDERNPGDGRDGSDSIGVGQWNADRARALTAFAQARGKSAGDFETQLAFIQHELETSETGAAAALRKATTPEQAAAAFIGYERPKGWSAADPTAGHGWENRRAHALRLAGPGGFDATSAEVIEDARKALERKRAAIAQDPLGAASREGLVESVPPLDFSAPAGVAAQLPARIAAAEAVAEAYGRAPSYIRPDEREGLKRTLAKGGDAALELMAQVAQGAGARAPAIYAEIGGEAPALAHAGLVMQATGDRAFARQVAEAQKARAVDGAKLPTPTAEDVSARMREVLGPSLAGLSAAETQRTRAAATAWAEIELQRRGIDPKGGEADKVIDEAIRRARGMTGPAGASFGGVAKIDFGRPGWFSAHGQSAAVQVPAEVRTDRFGEALDALADADLAGLADPPVAAGGRVATAAELRRLQPLFAPGGYRFVTIDPVTGQATPLAARSGKPFLLPWSEVAPKLRARVPGAFRP